MSLPGTRQACTRHLVRRRSYEVVRSQKVVKVQNETARKITRTWWKPQKCGGIMLALQQRSTAENKGRPGQCRVPCFVWKTRRARVAWVFRSVSTDVPAAKLRRLNSDNVCREKKNIFFTRHRSSLSFERRPASPAQKTCFMALLYRAAAVAEGQDPRLSRHTSERSSWQPLRQRPWRSTGAGEAST